MLNVQADAFFGRQSTASQFVENDNGRHRHFEKSDIRQKWGPDVFETLVQIVVSGYLRKRGRS